MSMMSKREEERMKETLNKFSEFIENHPEVLESKEKVVGDWTIPPIKIELNPEDIEVLKNHIEDYFNNIVNAVPERGRNV